MQDRCEPLNWLRETSPGADLFDPATPDPDTCTWAPIQAGPEPFRLRMALKWWSFGEPTLMHTNEPGPARRAFLALDARMERCTRFTGHVLRVCDAAGTFYPFSLEVAS